MNYVIGTWYVYRLKDNDLNCILCEEIGENTIRGQGFYLYRGKLVWYKNDWWPIRLIAREASTEEIEKIKLQYIFDLL